MAKRKPPQRTTESAQAPAHNHLAVVDLIGSFIGVLLLLVVVGLFAMRGTTLASEWALVALAALMILITAIAIAAVFRRSFRVEGKVGKDKSAKAEFD